MTEQFLENLCKQLGKSKSKTFGLVVSEQSLVERPKIIPPDAKPSDTSTSRGKDIEATSSAVSMNAKDAGQDLTVVKQIKHLGLQKVSSQPELGKSSKDQLVAKNVERQASALKNDQKFSNQLRGGLESSSLGTSPRNKPNNHETEAKDDLMHETRDDQMHGGAKDDQMHSGVKDDPVNSGAKDDQMYGGAEGVQMHGEAKMVLDHGIGKPGNNSSSGITIIIIVMFLIMIIIIKIE